METARPEPEKAPQGGLTVERIDHLVLWVRDIELSAGFYETICGMRRTIFGCGRVAMVFGSQKLNLNQRSLQGPAPPQLDFCLVTSQSSAVILAHLHRHRVDVRLGPVRRTGALGAMNSIYLLDPDANVVELASYLS